MGNEAGEDTSFKEYASKVLARESKDVIGDSDDIISLSGSAAAAAGFGIGDGLSYELIE